MDSRLPLLRAPTLGGAGCAPGVFRGGTSLLRSNHCCVEESAELGSSSLSTLPMYVVSCAKYMMDIPLPNHSVPLWLPLWPRLRIWRRHGRHYYSFCNCE